jgi:hypothetical protein
MTKALNMQSEDPLEVLSPAAPLESIVCTEKLLGRPSRPPDHQKENTALSALVSALADSPHTILQTLVDQVLETLDADSAGLSLLTKDGTRFYWAAIAGAWKPHLGGGTPRDFGPCGDVLDANVTLLFTHWERRYPYLSAAMPLAEEGLSSRIRGDYSSYYLFRLADIPQIRREIHYDLTKTSSLVLSHFSLFYAGRSPLRNFILVSTDRSYAELLQRVAAPRPHYPPDPEIERIAEGRLRDLRTLCSSHGARFAYLLAPGFGPGEAPLVDAGVRSETDVMVPINLNAFALDKFRDGFHLNAEGAKIFTQKVADLLRSRLTIH